VWVVLGSAGRASPCEVGSVYTATEIGARHRGPRIGVSEQLTRFGTLQRGSEEVANPADEYLLSSITQLWLGYRFTPRVGVQVNLPFISRTFRRLEGERLVHDDETGIGDLALLGDVLVYSRAGERTVLRLSVLGGIELPTGSSDRLAEELADRHAHAAPAASGRPAGGGVGQHTVGGEEGTPAARESGIHGHDLALGSGSVDGIVGGHLFWSRDRAFVTLAAQYVIRTEGDFAYRYANDLTWTGGPGFFPLLDHGRTLGVQFVLTGETKGNDVQAGRKTGDTGVTALYGGPGVRLTWRTSLTAEVVADLPLLQHNTGLQVVPDYRMRGAATWRF
jgi:hypothetical protein